MIVNLSDKERTDMFVEIEIGQIICDVYFKQGGQVVV